MNRKPIVGTERLVGCDTLLGSRPYSENELSRMAGAAINPVTHGPYVNELCRPQSQRYLLLAMLLSSTISLIG